MPYIIMKRDDIPAATLQVLDLDPNTSLRNLTLDVPGQTKYVNPVQNDDVIFRVDPITGAVLLRAEFCKFRLPVTKDMRREACQYADLAD